MEKFGELPKKEWNQRLSLRGSRRSHQVHFHILQLKSINFFSALNKHSLLDAKEKKWKTYNGK